MSIDEAPLIADFNALVRRPKPMEDGMVAELFAQNGGDADAVLELGKSSIQDALVDVDITNEHGQTLGGFCASLRRPKPLMSGMVACFYGENGDSADAIAALSLSKYQDAKVRVQVRMLQQPDGSAAKQTKAQGPFADQAAILWKSSFLGIPQVWIATGSDDDYLAWLRTQPCCVKPTKFGPHQGDIVPAHVWRLANGAGRGVKPPFSAIACCFEHHRIQHERGEGAIGGREWMEREGSRMVRVWVWDRIKAGLKVESMAYADPALVREWAVQRGLQAWLPPGYYTTPTLPQAEKTE